MNHIRCKNCGKMLAEVNKEFEFKETIQSAHATSDSVIVRIKCRCGKTETITVK